MAGGGIHPDRVAGGHRGHRDSGGVAPARFEPGEGFGQKHQLREQSAAIANLLAPLRGRLRWRLFVPNDWIDFEGGSSNGPVNNDYTQTSWYPGDARTDTTTSNIQSGLLFPYNTSTAIYHCPANVSTIEDANGNPLPQLRTRSYNMSQSVNGYPYLVDPQTGYAVDALQPCFATFASITNPTPTQLFVFIDENEVTLEDPQFGYPQPGSGWPFEWWDMPSNRHTQGCNLSFADGHAERWHWQSPMTATLPFRLCPTRARPAGARLHEGGKRHTTKVVRRPGGLRGRMAGGAFSIFSVLHKAFANRSRNPLVPNEDQRW